MEQEQLQRCLALIRGYEEGFANRLARRVIYKPKLNIWLFLVPFLFIYHFSELRRYREGLPAFARGFFRSKLHALEMAGEEVRLGRRKTEAEMVPPADPELDKPSMAEVRRKQVEESRLLLEHYRRLLARPALNYVEMLRKAYGGRREFQDFVEALQLAESELNKAVLATMAESEEKQEAQKVVARMEEESLKLRVADLTHFFPSDSHGV